MSETWRQLANCRDVDPALFFPNRRELEKANAAKAICRGCVCRVECLDFALKTDEYGVWGGTTEDERYTIKDILASSGADSYRSLLESESESHRDDHRDNSKPQRSPVSSIQPLVLNLQVRRESYTHALSETEVVQVESGFSVSAFTLRFEVG